MSDPLDITDKNRLLSLLAASDRGDTRAINEAEMATSLRSRVRGQDHLIEDLCRLIRSQWMKERRSKPIANILFLGPTGTGKTELCKALTGYLYDNEKSMLRIDCGELSGPEGKTRLIGTPTGYVGSDAGGHLTRPILNNPKQVVVFDEIEKAWSGVFDLFLSLMGDGRLTEQGSGRVADFTQSIVVLTSNAEHEAVGKIQNDISDPHERTDAVKKHLRDHKVFRAEIIGRIDRIYVFRPLTGITLAEIAALKMQNLAQQYRLNLAYVSPELILDAMTKGSNLKDFGARELDRVVDEMLADAMLQAKQDGATKIMIRGAADGSLIVDSVQ